MLSPVDIENKEFKKAKFGGYNIADVENFLEELLKDYETIYKENIEISEKLNSYIQIEEGIKTSMENAEKAAEEIKEKALEESKIMLESSRKQSVLEIEEMNLKIREKEIEFEQIKKEMRIYNIKLKSMLEAQLKILSEEN